MKKLITVQLLLYTFCSLNSFAQETALNKVSNKIYLNIFGGSSDGGRIGKFFPATELSNEAVYGFAVGKQLSEQFRFDMSLESRENYKINYTDSDNYLKYEYNLKVSSLAMIMNFYYDVMDFYGVTPYIVVGLGPSYNTTKSSSMRPIENDGTSITSYSISNGYKTYLAYKIGGGFNYNFNEKFTFGIQFQHVDLGKFRTGNEYTSSIGESSNEPSSKGRIKAKELIFIARYKL